ncbi:RNA polymerase sigma factor [Butyrivibrio sp. INlla16]|uniref:RNA polymerase sigma factor n=1 Tax=Butyrivibrio sp. INlla16 TaxID=1520807 RepID=UPI00088A6A9A|nr:sigma-70 family RNA polymerase sigma factor [Butyrivibrio sp. INlla16]SDB09592.1 RNA polymerase sigma factor, sigma-70 family [Butyrivibrio sp. INlla16]
MTTKCRMDEKLIRAIEDMAAGKEEGFNAVYSATYNHVYFRAKAYMKDEADAQDLTQIVYIEAYKNIKSLQNVESLFGWLDGICHNQGMKIFRKKKDVFLNGDEEGNDIFETLESNDLASLPELSADQKETSRIIQEFIDELPEVQKAAVIAYYFDGFSVGEIAQMQDCSEGTVKSRLNYARKFLKDKVEGTEKRDGIRLHVVALPTLYYAIRLMSENTKLSAKAAEGIYAGSCAHVGLTPGAIALGNAGAGMSANMAATGVAVAGAAGTAATGAGISIGVKALIIAGAILAGAGAGAGATYYVVNQNAAKTEKLADASDEDLEGLAEAVNQGDSEEQSQDAQNQDGTIPSGSGENNDGNNDESPDNTSDDVTLTEDEKIQIVDAIGFYSQDWLDAGNFVFCARLYAVYTLWNNPEGKKAFPWKKDDKLDVPFVKDFYKALGIEIPGDYDFDDNGVTVDSDNLLGEGELAMDYYAYEGLDIKNNGDGTYTLTGQYSWKSLDDEPGSAPSLFPFTATAVKGGNPDIFGGLIIKDCSTFDYSKWKVSSSKVSMNSELMAKKAAELIKQKQAEGIVDSYYPLYFVYDVTADGIPEFIVQQGTCEADYMMNIYTWVDAKSDWIKMGETLGAHVGDYWGKNSHDGFYGSSVHMGYEFVYDYDGKSNTTNQIYEGEVEWIDYPNGDSDIKTLYQPTDATLLTFYSDTSAGAIKSVIESAK